METLLATVIYVALWTGAAGLALLAWVLIRAVVDGVTGRERWP